LGNIVEMSTALRTEMAPVGCWPPARQALQGRECVAPATLSLNCFSAIQNRVEQSAFSVEH
jgi:hypothetical protein